MKGKLFHSPKPRGRDGETGGDDLGGRSGGEETAFERKRKDLLHRERGIQIFGKPFC